nr:PREDICTED: LOW QUALITY PROTEIN: uncharacterized protein LOC104638654 [Balearica regulorum gibbericeps]
MRMPKHYKRFSRVVEESLPLEILKIQLDITLSNFNFEVEVGSNLTADPVMSRKLDQLHSPMYFFPMNLSISDLGSIFVLVPKSMDNSILNTRFISCSGYVAQVFFFLFFTPACFLSSAVAYHCYVTTVALETEEIEQLSTLPSLLEDPSVVQLLRVKEQQVPVTTTIAHRQQHRTSWDSLIPIHKLIHQLESQGVISKTCSPFNSPIWPVQKSNGEWRLTVDYGGLNDCCRAGHVGISIGPGVKGSQVRMHIPNYHLIVSPLYHITQKKNDFKWGPEQRQAFEHIKPDIVHAVALEKAQAGPDVKNVLYTAARENDPTWSLWQKAPGETRGGPLGFWSLGYRGSEARYTPTEKEILVAYEGVGAAS